MPAPKLSYAPRENDLRMMRFVLDRLVEIAKAADAFDYRLQDYTVEDGVYQTPAWHLLGTCRMGAEPETSVINKWHQAWDVPNLYIIDGSVFTTGGVVNPTPTVSALALRAAEHLRDNFGDLRAARRSLAACGMTARGDLQERLSAFPRVGWRHSHPAGAAPRLSAALGGARRSGSSATT